jgi:hypothetical protein
VYDSGRDDHLYSRPDEEPIESPEQERIDRLYEQIIDTLGEEFQVDEGFETGDLDDSVEGNLRRLGYIE